MNSSYVPFSTGTTIMAAEYDGGVVIGADSRTSAAGYVINRVADKLTRITDNIYCCRSGAAADTQAIADHVTTLLRHHQFSKGKPAEVRMAANEFRKCCYANRRSMLAGIIVAGWDGKCGGQVYNIPLGGMMLRMPYAIGGSGSPFLHGYLKDKYRPGMDSEECIQLVKTAVKLGMHFDSSSGGVVRVGVIDKDGIKRHIFYNTESGESEVPSHRISTSFV